MARRPGVECRGRKTILEMNNPALQRRRHGLRAIGDAQFGEDTLQMVLRGVLGDAERVGEFLVRKSFRDFAQYVDFAWCELFEEIARLEPRGDIVGNPAPA